MNNISLSRSSCIIFDISCFSVATQKLDRFGFAVYPLIKLFQEREYFCSGLEILPVYRGLVPRKLIETLVSSTNIAPMALIEKMREDGEIQYAPGSASIIVKAVDSQRHSHFLKNLQEIVPKGSFLTNEEKFKYAYAGPSMQTPALASIVPNAAQQAST